jgi:hypothetical protein
MSPPVQLDRGWSWRDTLDLDRLDDVRERHLNAILLRRCPAAVCGARRTDFRGFRADAMGMPVGVCVKAGKCHRRRSAWSGSNVLLGRGLSSPPVWPSA